MIEDDPKEQARLVRKAFGTAINAARIEKCLSIRDLEEKTGINRNSIYRIEAGRLNATIDTYTALASALGLEVALIKD